ncbi:hypothetical protein [Trueperella sp. LYQ143]
MPDSIWARIFASHRRAAVLVVNVMGAEILLRPGWSGRTYRAR